MARQQGWVRIGLGGASAGASSTPRLASRRHGAKLRRGRLLTVAGSGEPEACQEGQTPVGEPRVPQVGVPRQRPRVAVLTGTDQATLDEEAHRREDAAV